MIDPNRCSGDPHMNMRGVESSQALTCCPGHPPLCGCRRHRQRILEGPKEEKGEGRRDGNGMLKSIGKGSIGEGRR